MHCNVKWDRRFMVNNLTKVFCDKTYREHRHQILFEQCKCHLSLISPILKIKHDYYDLQKKYNKYIQDRVQLDYKIYHLEKEMKSVSRDIRKHELRFIREDYSDNFDQIENQRPCVTEKCLGFLDSKGFCPICKNTTCLSCNVQKHEENEHSCNENDKLIWQNLKKTTKPCPSCHVRIFKITGCDQMWCTNCNTAFSWSKGTIERGSIHNPHYFDWIFNDANHQNEAPGMDENAHCNEDLLPSLHRLKNVIDKRARIERNAEDVEHRGFIISRYRMLVHIREVEIPILQGLYYNPDNLNIQQIYRKKLLPFLYL